MVKTALAKYHPQIRVATQFDKMWRKSWHWCSKSFINAQCKRALIGDALAWFSLNVRVWFQIADILSSCGGRMSASEHSDYGYFEKRLQKNLQRRNRWVHFTFAQLQQTLCFTGFLWGDHFRIMAKKFHIMFFENKFKALLEGVDV